MSRDFELLAGDNVMSFDVTQKHHNIMLTSLYSLDPFKAHFYTGKLGFAWVYSMSLFYRYLMFFARRSILNVISFKLSITYNYSDGKGSGLGSGLDTNSIISYRFTKVTYQCSVTYILHRHVT